MAKPRRGLAADDLFGDLIPGGPVPASPPASPATPVAAAVSELPPADPTNTPPTAGKRTSTSSSRSRKTAPRRKKTDKRPASPARAAARPATGGASRLSAMVASEVLEAARDAVYVTPGLTLAGLVEEALRRELRRLERERGEPFPPRKGELPRGRRVQ